MTYRTGLARKPAARNRTPHVILRGPVDDFHRLADDHLQHGTRKIGRSVFAVDGQLTAAGLDQTRATAFFRLPVA